jgi:hypothetical protein
MTRTISVRGAWHPQTVLDQEEILRELQQVIASPHFCNSKRYPALLQYIVENTLAGKSGLLKERTLGVEVFDRPPAYDTNTDTVVRYTAGEVRKRLLLYYSELGRSSGIRISLPAGSYIPEFFHGHPDVEEIEEHTGFSATPIADRSHFAETAGVSHGLEPITVSPPVHRAYPVELGSEVSFGQSSRRPGGIARRPLWLVLAAMVPIVVIAAWTWRSRSALPETAVADFWGPVLRDQRTVVICTGGVIFKDNNYSGVMTAGKDNEYPFVSMQIASAIAQVSGLLERSGAAVQLLPSPSTPLTELREHSVVLLGGYNNHWAMRLLQSQRFQFTPEPVESIVDRTEPQMHWSRDHSLPYSSADDLALVARFRDATTGSWVVVLAGLGRNGTEAAAQFATSPYYMQLLKDRLGKDFSNRSVEAILRVSVIDGKTGAPSILAVHVQ